MATARDAIPSSQGNDGSKHTTGSDYSRQPIQDIDIHRKKALAPYLEAITLMTNARQEIGHVFGTGEQKAVIRMTIEMLVNFPGIGALGITPLGEFAKGLDKKCDWKIPAEGDPSLRDRVIEITNDSLGARGDGTNCSLYEEEPDGDEKDRKLLRQYFLFLDEKGNIVFLCLHLRERDHVVDFPHLASLGYVGDEMLRGFLKKDPSLFSHIIYQLYLRASEAAVTALRRSNALGMSQSYMAILAQEARTFGNTGEANKDLALAS